MDTHSIIKVTTGILIVPLGIAVSYLWNWWMKATLPMQIASGILVVPLAFVTHLMCDWWDGF